MSSCTSGLQQFLKASHTTFIETYSNFDVMFQKYSGSTIQETALHIQNIALFALQILVTSVLFLSNSSLFVLGAVVSVINKDIIDHSIAKIGNVWEKLSAPKRALVITAAVFAWPISLASAAFFVGGHLTSHLQDN